MSFWSFKRILEINVAILISINFRKYIYVVILKTYRFIRFWLILLLKVSKDKPTISGIISNYEITLYFQKRFSKGFCYFFTVYTHAWNTHLYLTLLNIKHISPNHCFNISNYQKLIQEMYIKFYSFLMFMCKIYCYT